MILRLSAQTNGQMMLKVSKQDSSVTEWNCNLSKKSECCIFRNVYIMLTIQTRDIVYFHDQISKPIADTVKFSKSIHAHSVCVCVFFWTWKTPLNDVIVSWIKNV